MPNALIKNPDGFKYGYTPVVTLDDDNGAVGINFGILKCKSGEEKNLTSEFESAYLLMSGKLMFYYDNTNYTAERSSIFDEEPIAAHFSKDSCVKIKAERDCELAVCQVVNKKEFNTIIFDSKNMSNSEPRGKGILDNTSYRIVRTIFDIKNRPDSNMVLGEDINFPGRWSSYPPHHHPQPEIYHYRFTKPQGYGHAELGDKVFKVHNYDTIKILDENDHAQVSAPGYGMYYIWVIRHLPGNPYEAPKFTLEHRWTMAPNTVYWKPKI